MRVQRWTVGDLRVHAVVQALIPVSPSRLFGDAAGELPAGLQPDYVDDSGNILVAVQSFLVESATALVLVDTCFADSSPLPLDMPDRHAESLAATGFHPEDVSAVVCTHLHRDHAGGNTTTVRGQWVPTYPNADYLVTAAEYHHWRRCTGDDRAPRECVEPLERSGTLRLVDMEYRVSDGIDLVPTPGHTPGHVSVRLESAGSVAFISGDVVHHPVQIGDLEICALPDADRVAARTSRARLFRRAVDEQALLFGSHFAAPAAGFLRNGAEGMRWEPLTSEKG